MPSPFPGMDPYLEDPAIWPDFHHALASEISAHLNAALPRPYYAKIETRVELGIVAEDFELRRIVIPDISVHHDPQGSKAGATTAILDRPRHEISPRLLFDLPADPYDHPYVEIRDSKEGHRLITVIEILSPSNNRRGPDRDAYSAKQAEVLKSEASLVEIDLLRGGARVLPSPILDHWLKYFDGPTDYVTFVRASWHRTGPGLGYQAFPSGLRQWLPCIPVPLRHQEPELPLDLQYLLNLAYDRGGYARGAVDYTSPPIPPLSPTDVAWATGLLANRNLR